MGKRYIVMQRSISCAVQRLTSITVTLSLLFQLSGSELRAYASDLNQTNICGKWELQQSTDDEDKRIEVAAMGASSSDQCQSSYQITNTTGIAVNKWLSIGGHTLELKPILSDIELTWNPPGDPDGITYLPAGQSIFAEAVPADRNRSAAVNINGNITTKSLVVDFSIHLFGFLLDLAPLPCILSNENQLVWIPIKASYVVEAQVKRLLERDYDGFVGNFATMLNEYSELVASYITASVKECTKDVVEKGFTGKIKLLSKNVIAIIKLAWNFIGWFLGVISDYLKYKGQPAHFAYIYTPPGVKSIAGLWEGILEYAGEAGSGNDSITIEISLTCSTGSPCVKHLQQFDVPLVACKSFPDWDPTAPSTYCFSDGSFVFYVFALQPDGTLSLSGQEPLTGLSGVFTRTSKIRAVARDNGTVYLANMQILDIMKDAPSCFSVDRIVYSPTEEHFLILLQCYEGDNEAFVFRADGSDKRQITEQWDYINYSNAAWSWNGKFIAYARVNSCCVSPQDIPLSAPPKGLVRYDIETGNKTLLVTDVYPFPMEWSPNGRWIAFLFSGATEPRRGTLYLVETDSSGLWELDKSVLAEECYRLLWDWEEPDMSLRLYCESANGTRYQSYLINAVFGAPPSETAVQVLQATPPADATFYRVTGVSSNDVLNVRFGPGVANSVVGTIPPDGMDIQITGEGTQVGLDFWVPINYKGITGWVNIIYLAIQPTR